MHSAKGAMKAENISSAPDAFSIVTAIIRPTREGRMETVEEIPSFAPATKLSNTGTFLISPKIMIMQTVTGTT